MDEKEYVLEKPIPPAPPANASKAVKDAYKKHVKDDNQVSCVMLATMITELQKQHDDMKAHEMIVALRQLYQGQSRHERFLKEMATDLIVQSLPELYKGFVMNYMMHDLDKPLPGLLKMLETAEENLTKGKGASVHMVQGGKGKPKKGIKIKARTVGKPKSKSTSSTTQKPVGGVAKGKCHHCESFWGYALSTAIYTLNRAPTKAVEGTPYQLWTGKCPVLSHLKIWDCEAYVKRLMTNCKLDARSDMCFFVGYPKETHRYSFYHPINKKVFVACNGVFLEKEFLSHATSGRKIELEEIRDDEETTAPVQEHELEEQTVVPQNAQDTQEPHRSNRLRTQPVRYGFILTFEGDVILIDQDEPETYLEAISCPEAEEWRQAMQSEMDSMYTNQLVSFALTVDLFFLKLTIQRTPPRSQIAY
ncbi:unnamed protein product [Cuscuta campestris]|uniref:Retroviral polymerase SH3-like domain-containing protein n=1 Tax=Cuscuta campestris TaxID=132261 RepID=A0A484M0L4_9ASTE|nr:unnamed protein product [Cuscuta campestris]